MKNISLSLLLILPILVFGDESDDGLIFLNCLNEVIPLRDSDQNETVVIDTKKKLFSSKNAYEWKLTENDTYYFASLMNQFALVEYNLNRINLKLSYKNTQVEDGKVNPTEWSYIDYQCQKVDRI